MITRRTKRIVKPLIGGSALVMLFILSLLTAACLLGAAKSAGNGTVQLFASDMAILGEDYDFIIAGVSFSALGEPLDYTQESDTYTLDEYTGYEIYAKITVLFGPGGGRIEVADGGEFDYSEVKDGLSVERIALFNINGHITYNIIDSDEKIKAITLSTNNKLDNAPPPLLFIRASDSNGARIIEGDSGFWTDGSITMTFECHNQALIISGVTYQYKRAHMTDWEDISTLYTPTSDTIYWSDDGGSTEKQTLIFYNNDKDGINNGCYEFRAITGAKVDSKPPYQNWYVQIDEEGEPVFVDEEDYAPAWIKTDNSSVRLEKNKIKDAKGNDITVYYIASWTNENVDLEFKVRYTGAAGSLSLEGGRIRDLDEDGDGLEITYAYTFRENGAVEFTAVNPNGKKQTIIISTLNYGEYDPQKPDEDLPGFIERVSPVIIVATSTASLDDSLWVNTGVIFNFSVVAIPSGVKEYHCQWWQDGAGEPGSGDYTTRTFEPREPNAVEFTKETDNGRYRFRVKSEAGTTSDWSNWYYVRIDKNSPNLTVGDPDASTWTNKNVSVTVTVIYSVSGPRGDSPFVVLGGVRGEDYHLNETHIVGGVWEYELQFVKNPSVTVQAFGRNGNTSPSRPIAFNRIDIETPALDVYATNNSHITGDPAWANGAVRFDLAIRNATSGLLRYEYRIENGEWHMITGNFIIFSDSGDYGVFFKAISVAGNEYVTDRLYRVKIDAVTPEVEIIRYRVGDGDLKQDKPAAMTKENITVYFKILHGFSDVVVTGSASLSVAVDFEGEDGNIYYYDFKENGVITVLARSGAGLTSEPFEISVSNINNIPPNIHGSMSDEELTFNNGSVRTFSKPVTIVIENISNLTVEVYDDNDKVVHIDFNPVTGEAVFNKNGGYRIVVTDAVGNGNVAQFFIKKPNLGLIISLPAVGAAILAGFSFLLFITVKRGNALKRLIANTTLSDDKVDFMMMKVIKQK